MDAFANPRVGSVLGAARQAYVAVSSTRGPHVTPQLYGLADGRLWFFAASSTLKSRVLRRDARVGIVVRDGERAVVAAGQASVLDPAELGSVLRRFPEWREIAGGVASFSLRNAADLAGFVTDSVRRRAGRIPPPRRVLFAVDADRVALMEGSAVAEAWGGWDGEAQAATAPASAVADAAGKAAVAGWSAAAGPLALPVAWDESERTASVAPALASLAGISGRSQMSVVFDDYGRPGPAGKQGMLLRGHGVVEAQAGGESRSVRVRFEPDRAIRWDGVHTERVDPKVATGADPRPYDPSRAW